MFAQILRRMSQEAAVPNAGGPIQQKIAQKLTAAFDPLHLEIINESNQHNVPKGSESHFKVIIVSNLFDGKSKLNQHRMVNESLKEELANNIHALSITAKVSISIKQKKPYRYLHIGDVNLIEIETDSRKMGKKTACRQISTLLGWFTEVKVFLQIRICSECKDSCCIN